ncbi:hypothetical protein [Pseudomonas mohnii]
MLVNKEETKRVFISGLVPGRRGLATQSFGKTRELVAAKRLPQMLPTVMASPSQIGIAFKTLFELIDALSPFNQMDEAIVSHMSGLLGLFVGKQKATTDAPDTYTA